MYKGISYITARGGLAEPAAARPLPAFEARAAVRRAGGLATGGRSPAAGGAGRMGGALLQQLGAQPGWLPVRHHPEGDPWGVQGLGGRQRHGAACFPSTRTGTGAIGTAGRSEEHTSEL